MDVPLIRFTEQSLKSTTVKHVLTVKHSNVFTHSGAEARFLPGASELSPAALRALRMG